MAKRRLATKLQLWLTTSRLNQRPLVTAHRWLYRRTRGLLGSRVWGMPVLLLTTRGRKTGQPRTTPLNYVRDDRGNFVVVASNSGREVPAWWLNLQAEPTACVQLGRAVKAVRAEVATGQERPQLWSRVLDQNPVYADFQRVARREIPLVVLHERCEP